MRKKIVWEDMDIGRGDVVSLSNKLFSTRVALNWSYFLCNLLALGVAVRLWVRGEIKLACGLRRGCVKGSWSTSPSPIWPSGLKMHAGKSPLSSTPSREAKCPHVGPGPPSTPPLLSREAIISLVGESPLNRRLALLLACSISARLRALSSSSSSRCFTSSSHAAKCPSTPDGCLCL